MFSTLVSAWTGTLCSAYLLGISGHRRSFVKSEWAAVRGSLSNLSICVWPQHQLFAPQPDSHSRRLKLISTRCRLISSCLMYSSAGQGRIKGARGPRPSYFLRPYAGVTCLDVCLVTVTQRKIGRLVLNLFQTRDTITVLHQFTTLTQFLFNIHEYFLICENCKCLIWQL